MPGDYRSFPSWGTSGIMNAFAPFLPSKRGNHRQHQDVQSLRRALGLGGVAEKNWQPPRRAAEVGLWQQLIVLV